MTHPENGKPLWNESRVESLLEAFFRKEMPPALRGPNPARPPRAPFPSAPAPSPPRNRAAKSRANSLVGLMMVGFSSLLMLMLAFLAGNDSGFSPSDSGPGSSIHSTSDDSSSGGNDASDPLKQNDQDPVEMRSRIRPVGTEDLLNPSGEKSPFPELDIEVYPLDREPATDEEPEKSQLPESRTNKTPRTPMPEETRQLPENKPSESTDPDEARLEPLLQPLLPELGGISETLPVL